MQELKAKITLTNGTSYITPCDNLDNVKRMLAGKYLDIEVLGYKNEVNSLFVSDEDNQKTELRKRYEEVFGKKPGNKSIETMLNEISEQEATN